VRKTISTIVLHFSAILQRGSSLTQQIPPPVLRPPRAAPTPTLVLHERPCAGPQPPIHTFRLKDVASKFPHHFLTKKCWPYNWEESHTPRTHLPEGRGRGVFGSQRLAAGPSILKYDTPPPHGEVGPNQDALIGRERAMPPRVCFD